MTTPDRPWPLGPYRLLDSMFNRRRGKEVGTSVQFAYPSDQYEAFDHVRSRAQGELMVLAPEMAEAILRADEHGSFPQEVESHIYEVALKIRAIDGLRDWGCKGCAREIRGDYSSSPRCVECGEVFLPKA